MPVSEPVLENDQNGSFSKASVEIDLDTPPSTGDAEPQEPTTTEDETTTTLELAAPADPERPAWLPAKFKTPEEFAASYGELERKLGAPAPTPPPTPAAGEAPKAGETPAVPAGLLTDAELTAYAQEVNSTGKLSDSSYAALTAKGLPKSLIDGHVAGLQALRQTIMDDSLKVFGGAKEYKKVADWALQNLDPQAMAQYNADVKSGDPGRVKYATEGLQARFAAANPSTPAPARLHGRRAPAGPAGYANMAQQQADQADPRYWTDADFRNAVDQRIARSNFEA